MLTAVSFALFGFIIGIWAETFEQLAIIPSLVVTPLTFLGGAFYSIDMLPQPWRTVSLFNPVVYLVSGFRWSFSIRGGRCRCPGEPRLHRGLHGAVPGVAVVDLPHGLSPEALNRNEVTRASRFLEQAFGSVARWQWQRCVSRQAGHEVCVLHCLLTEVSVDSWPAAWRRSWSFRRGSLFP